tara:strand:+ start:458 stop:769 length:312 start_codon:yes stop_codon:yes gene_type:complete
MKNKKIVFEELEDQHARMVVRLRYDRLTQGNFFRGIIDLYVNGDLDLVRAVEKIKERKSTMGKKKRVSSTKEIKEGQRLIDDFGLSKSEKNFVYDLIEEDFED